MNEKIKNILKIVGCYIGIIFILYFLLQLAESIITHTLSFSKLLKLFIDIVWPILGWLAFVVVFSPSIIALYFLYKKFQNNLYRILLTAFIFPFNNLVYLFIEHYYLYSFSQGYISAIISATLLIIILPSVFVATFFIPKSILSFENKKRIVLTIILMGILGWLMIIISSCSMNFIDNQIDKNMLKKYDTMIESIENYKAENSVYPLDLIVTENPYKSQNVNYEVYNNKQDYKLTITSNNTYYTHCSNKNIDGCDSSADNILYYPKNRKWIKVADDD